MYIVRGENLSKVYGDGTTALKNVNLSIQKGSFCVIAGPNGAGKTTFLRILYNELKPTSGTVSISISKGGSVLPSTEDIKRVMGVMPQEITLYENLSVWEHVYYLTSLKGLPKDESRKASRKVLEMLDLWQRKNTIVRNLSGGLKRRVCLAQALAGDNELLILDEPTNGLDPELRRRTLEILRACRDQGASIIFTTHYLDEIEDYVDQLIVFNKGRIVYDGSAEDVLRRILYDFKIELRTSNRLVNKIEGLGLRYSAVGDELSIYVRQNEPQDIKNLSDLLTHEDLTDMKISRPSLEEGYLKLVEEAL